MSIYLGPVPQHMPVIPPDWIRSLHRDDDLKTQRDLMRAVLGECLEIPRTYFETGNHPAVTPEMASRTLRNTDHTTLLSTRNESAAFMERMAHEATHPIPMRSVCTRLDGDESPYSNKLTPVIEGLRDFPNVGITVVLGYPHGFADADDARRTIDYARNLLRDVKNPLDIDTVCNYSAWMNGDRDFVRSVLTATGEAARQNGFVWKAIQEVSVHSHGTNRLYPGDPVRSVYDLSLLSLEAGADCVKTSTGVAAEPPFNYLVAQDTGVIFRSLPMLAALADFNRQNGTQRWPKFSGGNTNEADAAVSTHASRKMLGDDVAEKIVFGTSYRFRGQLLTFIANKTWPNCPFDVDVLKPYGVEVAAIREHRMGIASPATPGLLAG